MKMKFKINLSDSLKLIVYTTICIMLVMIVVPSITITSKLSESDGLAEEIDNIVEGESKVEDIVLDGNETVKVYITSENRIEEINIEDYICGVVSSEMPASFELEALKAQAIAARTYLASKRIKNCTKANGADICDSTHCQAYTSKAVRFELWSDDVRDEYWSKISEAVNATKGQVLSYEGELVLYPQFFSTSSGRTENSVDLYWADIPYLKSVESEGEEISPKFTSEKILSIEDFISKFEQEYENYTLNESNIENNIEIVSRSEAGGVKEINVAGESIRGQDFRFLVGLNSSNFTYDISGGNIIFNCKGYGHGVGMSQWGANVMAKEGKTYNEILKHYYTGVEISNLKFKG